MKKSQIKIAVKKAMLSYYKTGMTNTAHRVYTEIMDAVDRTYKSKHKK